MQEVSTERKKQTMLLRWTRWLVNAILASLVIVVFVACSAASVAPSASPGPTTPAPTPIPKGIVLYQADWSHHLQDWHPSTGWQVTGNVLQSVTKGDLSLTVPYQPTMSDYALVFQVQVVKMTQTLGQYMITVDPSSTRNGYQCGILGFPRPDKETNSIHPQVEVYTEPLDLTGQTTAPHDQAVGYQWHDYRIEIHGNQLFFYFDNQLSGRTLAQTKTFASGPIKFAVTDIGLRIGSFRIVTA